MEVLILDVKSMREVYKYRLNVANNDRGPTEEELFVLAWRCALSDGVVKEEEHSQYILCSGEQD